MPRLTDNMEIGKIGNMQSFQFSSTRIDQLGATEYTLVTIAVDETGSVAGFADDLHKALVTAVEACQKSPRSDNLLIRVIKFSTRFPNNVEEIHGFKPLSEIVASDYPQFNPGGMTPLCDACYSSIGAMNAYGKDLADNDFGVNAIAFIITDGVENASTTTMAMVKEEADKAVLNEELESLVSVLIGINATDCASKLNQFKDKAGLTQFIDAGDATKGKLAKLAAFVSKSTSSQSQALGTGGASRQISATI